MGQGSINDDKGEGLYTLILDYGTLKVAARIAKLQEQLDDLIEERTPLQNKINSVQSKLTFKQIQIEASITIVRNADGSLKIEIENDLNKLVEEGMKLSFNLQQLNEDMAHNLLTGATLEERIARLQALALVEVRDTWCVDYTTDATGLVETIEIAGEQPHILIAPGARPATGGGGQMVHRMAQTGAATYFNAAVLPGRQRYRPLYRQGTLTLIDRENNEGTVDIGPEFSSAQNIQVNRDFVVKAPFEYMDCDHGAFLTGDDVVVRFNSRDWDQPVIIGFQNNPRQCGPPYIVLPILQAGGVRRPGNLVQGMPVKLEYHPDYDPPIPPKDDNLSPLLRGYVTGFSINSPFPGGASRYTYMAGPADSLPDQQPGWTPVDIQSWIGFNEHRDIRLGIDSDGLMRGDAQWDSDYFVTTAATTIPTTPSSFDEVAYQDIVTGSGGLFNFRYARSMTLLYSEQLIPMSTWEELEANAGFELIRRWNPGVPSGYGEGIQVGPTFSALDAPNDSVDPFTTSFMNSCYPGIPQTIHAQRKGTEKQIPYRLHRWGALTPEFFENYKGDISVADFNQFNQICVIYQIGA